MPILELSQHNQLLERRGTWSDVLFWVSARNRDTGVSETIGFWTGDDHQQISVGGEQRTYFGAGNFLDVPSIRAGTGLRVRQHRLALAPFTDEARALAAYAVRCAESLGAQGTEALSGGAKPVFAEL